MSGHEAYLSFWGKAGAAIGDGPPTHPVAYHGLDVAACADALLAAHPRTLAKTAALLGTSDDNARRCIVALIALHDIGKFADAFQWKVREHWPRDVLGKDWRGGDGQHHTVVALDLVETLELATLLKPAFDDKDWIDGFQSLWASIACHHGKPMPPAGAAAVRLCMSVKAERAAQAFATDVAQLFGPYRPIAAPAAKSSAAQTLSWLIAGLANLADWVGSNREQFPYARPDLPIAAYWEYTRKRAAKAVADAGLLPSAITPDPGFATLFPSLSDRQPSPLQTWAQSVALPDGPLLCVIEDVTGSGKTEAALLLAARLMASDRAGGLFFALPTMATANAMFDRLGDSYRRMFDGAHDPSLVLAHGRSRLHAGFTDSILPTDASSDQRSADARGDGLQRNDVKF